MQLKMKCQTPGDDYTPKYYILYIVTPQKNNKKTICTEIVQNKAARDVFFRAAGKILAAALENLRKCGIIYRSTDT